MPIEPNPSPQSFKRMPESPEVRQAIRRAAADAVFERPPTREELRLQADALVGRLGLPKDYVGFAMVSLSNAWWSDAFADVPFEKRLLLLPQCLRSSEACAAAFDGREWMCAHCGSCRIGDVQKRAEHLGYRVAIAEGVTSVTQHALEGQADAILGVACLDSLEKSHGRIFEWGIPHMAVPLLTDGCQGTEADLAELVRCLELRRHTPARSYASYIPLLRFAKKLFDRPWIEDDADADRIAAQWLTAGGKRFRPFVTLASYAVARHGLEVLDSKTDLDPLLPEAVHRLAVAIEAVHKASLAHDDIEDGDAMRYGRETLHRAHGAPIAINTGDYLVGLGYRLVASCAGELGPEAVADILGRLAAAHVELCRGKGRSCAGCANGQTPSRRWRLSGDTARKPGRPSPRLSSQACAPPVKWRRLMPSTATAPTLERPTRFLTTWTIGRTRTTRAPSGSMRGPCAQRCCWPSRWNRARGRPSKRLFVSPRAARRSPSWPTCTANQEPWKRPNRFTPSSGNASWMPLKATPTQRTVRCSEFLANVVLPHRRLP